MKSGPSSDSVTASLEIPASADGLERVAAAFDAFSAAHALPSGVAHSVQVALDELLSNTIRAGFPSGDSGHIRVSFELSNDALQLAIADDGIPFDPLERADPDTSAPLEARPVGGLGIFFVKQLMDEVHYRRADGMNHLRLMKRIIRGS